MDNQLAHEALALPKPYSLHLEAMCVLITSKGSFRPVGHLHVAGCKTRFAIEKKLLSKELEASALIIACGRQTLREAMKGYRWHLHLFQTISRPMKQAFCQEPGNAHR